jgi:hypothetical protein
MTRSMVPIYSIDSKPFGLSFGDWSIRWWQWLLSIPIESNPAADTTGINTNKNQNDPNVFFLCQTYEAVKLIPYRGADIPLNRSIFMPIINWISILGYDAESDQDLVAIAKKKMDVVANLEIKIDGIVIMEDLKKYRVQSPFFEAELPTDNLLGLSAGTKRCVSDGYWIFLKPFKESISLSTSGSCSSGLTNIGVQYHLNIV